MNYQRPHLQLLKARVSEKRKFIQVMMGPRQVGKTTLLTQLLSKLKQPHHFAAADAVANSNSVWIKQQWETARLKLKQEGADELLLVIDEIQKIDNWSEVVKQLCLPFRMEPMKFMQIPSRQHWILCGQSTLQGSGCSTSLK